MPTYSENRSWSDTFINPIKEIVGPRLLEPAPIELDCCESTDMLIFKASDVRIGCRVRRANIWDMHEDYRWQFTMRSGIANGSPTEINKITEGWGDWLFYGHEDSETPWPSFRAWIIVDLHSWRAHMIRRPKNNVVCGETENGDGKTRFAWFDFRSFPKQPPILIDSSQQLTI